MGAGPQLQISEIFSSIQGEGRLTGVPSVFVRTAGCNLRCRWCDTPETSWRPAGEAMSVAAIVRAVAAFTSVRHVVVTGGEPMIAKGTPALCRALAERGYHLTVETAGTAFEPLPVDLWSISPKLASSTPGPDAAAWAARHEARRRRPDVLRAMIASADYQLKFVVADPAELPEVEALVAEVGAAPDKTLLMPEGTTVGALDRGAAWLVPACVARGWRFADRLHIRLFGHTRGT